MDMTQLNEALSNIYVEEHARIVFWNDPQQEFDEMLSHYSDQSRVLDLDEGVIVNYGRFGDLLAEVKSITGKNPIVEVTT